MKRAAGPRSSVGWTMPRPKAASHGSTMPYAARRPPSACSRPPPAARRRPMAYGNIPAGGFALDLPNFDQDPIHVHGTVQPFCFLVALTAAWLVSAAPRFEVSRLGKGGGSKDKTWGVP